MEQPKAARNHSSLYLCAPVNALVEGIYDESIPLAEIKQHGDFGLGTFDHLDGEMVMLDGKTYQMTNDGRVAEVDDAHTTPFACVTFYQMHSTDAIEKDINYAEFTAWVESLLLSPNMFYGIRIEGMFSHMKVRSVPKQENYRPLVEVAHDQAVFNFHEIEGTLAGFYTPSFMSTVSVPGLHLHFLSKDLQHGGHLLECSSRKMQVGIQFINKIELSLPVTLDYLTADFHRDVKGDLKQAEN
jgi:acetolactate decarboxylase